VRYLLDTAIFLWSLSEPEKLNKKAQHLLVAGNGELYLSAVSAWEIAIKSESGKLRLADPPIDYVLNRIKLLGLRPLQITHVHALSTCGLPPHHQDPFDRLLIAQARSEDMVVMTADRLFSKYPVQTLWCGQ